MYFSYESNKQDHLRFYYDLLRKHLEQGDNTHLELLQNIAKSTQQIASGDKTFYDIDREIYDVVSELVKYDFTKEYFKDNIDIDNVTDSDLSTIKNTLSSSIIDSDFNDF